MKTVKIIDEKSKHFGKEFEGHCFYFDHKHTGHSADLFVIKTDNGEETILSTSIDVGHYWEQVRQEKIKKIGADVGDKVIIKETTSGCYSSDFDIEKPHIITSIADNGNVVFDNGIANMYMPKVERI
jgi:hypothetical protein